MKPGFDPVTLATPFFILTVLLEIALARLNLIKSRYETKDTAVSLTMGLVSTLAGLPLAAVIAAVGFWAYQHRLVTIPADAWWAWVAVFLLEDVTYYGFHRLSHERRFWWPGPPGEVARARHAQHAAEQPDRMLGGLGGDEHVPVHRGALARAK